MTKEPYFILLETATDSCSAALSLGDRVISEKYICTPKAHASTLATFVQELLEENNLDMSRVSAVGVSEGPGSYTGLRVGASVAKGLCFGAEIPLIGVGTPAVIAQVAIDSGEYNDDCYIVPMIDAGRMEVYTALFDNSGKQLTSVEAMILDKNSFCNELSEKRVLFTGNGAAKFTPLVEGCKNAQFAEYLPHATGLRVETYRRYKNGDLDDVAYFQPFYLKDFIAGKPKKLL